MLKSASALFAPHTHDVVLERGHEPVRLEDEVERLPQRDVLQVAGERAIDVRIQHDAQVRVPHEQQQEFANGNGLGEAEGERLVHCLRPPAFLDLADGERRKTRLRRRLAAMPGRAGSSAPSGAVPTPCAGNGIAIVSRRAASVRSAVTCACWAPCRTRAIAAQTLVSEATRLLVGLSVYLL
jgi:hypothetical protein